MTFQVANQQFLAANLNFVRAALEDHASGPQQTPQLASPPVWQGAEGDRPPALKVLCDAFGLTPFERSVLLLCAGMELDSAFPLLCARASGDPHKLYPTFSLALAALPSPHWDALTPSANLRHNNLVEVEAGPSLVNARLSVPERVWQFLLGLEGVDSRLERHLVSLPENRAITPSQERIGGAIASAVTKAFQVGAAPSVLLCGKGRTVQAAVAAAAAAQVGLGLWKVSADSLPSSSEEVESFGRALYRDAILNAQAVLLDCHGIDVADASRMSSVTRLLSTTRTLMFVSCRERRVFGECPLLVFEVESPPPLEQTALWVDVLGRSLSSESSAKGVASPGPPPWVGSVATVLSCQFDLDAAAIQGAVSTALGVLARADATANEGACLDALWEACRAECRPRVGDLARRIESSAMWEDLVLPPAQMDVLKDVELFARRPRALDIRGSRGQGTSVLFSGPSGTGKTLAAEVLANRMRLDLWRVDLSAVVSKYIGETEKNLARIFDAAEAGGAVLLFDEADAVFGKRSLVRDSHDRYANVEVSYLLQRVETFCGLAILTTNMKSGIDEAFLRRMRFIVDFPLPDKIGREGIWRRVFPDAVSTSELDFSRLAQLQVSGASIKNIAVHAALLAAHTQSGDSRTPLRMHHVRTAAKREYDKLQQPLTSLETRGWD